MKKAKTTKKRHSIVSPLLLIPAGLAGAAVYLFLNLYSPSRDNEAVRETVARLQAMENSDISQLMSMISQNTASAGSGSGRAASETETAIKNGQVLDNVTIRKVFQKTVILGDSITESIWEYGYLDQDVVISQRGLSVVNADEQIETAISLWPSVIFMAFGSNDLESYESNYQPFIDAYRKQIERLQAALPGVPIYINLILPIQQSAIDSIPALGNYPQYNEALKSLGAETGCICIDNSFIVEGRDDLYEPDGEHVISEYYPMWLTNMAETAGLV